MGSNLLEIRGMQINVRIKYNFASTGLEQLKSQPMVNVGGMWVYRNPHALLVGVQPGSSSLRYKYQCHSYLRP